MPYDPMPLAFKAHLVKGLSDKLTLSHYVNNYGGAVRRLNAITARLGALDWASAPVFEINGLKREELIAMNSMILHEVYFDGIGEDGGGDPSGAFAQALERDFGSGGAWRTQITAMAKAQGGGSGWTVLTWSPRAGKLVNAWAADHTHGIGDGVPIFAIDMYEHAYHLDFGAKAAAYVDALMATVHWGRVAQRWQRATEHGPSVPTAFVDNAGHPMVTVPDVQARLARGEKLVVLDVCLSEDVHRNTEMLPGATWRDPKKVAEWAGELPRGVPVVAYCLYGFQVSQNAVTALRQHGVEANSLAGGIAAWRASGLATTPRP
ncbi:MAG: superoxide dismutase [Alphaproteobacteria bacterium]|nr:superoxide dismutase [Alphaproteobacteria bacterium]